MYGCVDRDAKRKCVCGGKRGGLNECENNKDPLYIFVHCAFGR